MLMVGGSLTVLVLAISALFFFGYIQSLDARLAAVRERVPKAFSVYRVRPGDPEAAARAIVDTVDCVGLRLLSFNYRLLVVAKAADPGSPRSPIAYETRPLYAGLPVPAFGLGERLALGLETAFGLRSAHFSFGGVGIEINADPSVLVWAARRFAFVLLGIFLFIALFSYVAARLLTRQAMRPLEEVVGALEAFGAGDLTPRPVEAVANDEFGRLAAAHNRAVEQMAAAFTERDRAEAEIRRFIADAAHQLRTPLTVIQGFIGILLKNDARTQADRERILCSMDRQSRSMGSMIEKLTLLDRWEGSQAEPQLTDIGDCMAAVIQPLAAAYPDRRVSFSQEPVCYAFVDSAEIREAFGNIIDNALKYGGGAPVTAAVAKDDEFVRAIIADGGPGMSESEVRHAFDRFYRGEQRDVAGSGLGLAISKRAVERAGGTISIESRPGAGTKVTIAFPRALMGTIAAKS